MNFLIPIAIALALSAAAEMGAESGVDWPWAVLPLLALPHLCGRRVRGALERRDFRAARRLDRVAGLLPLGLHAVAVCGLGWGAFLRGWIGDSASALDWPGPGLVLLLAPYLVAQALSIDARARAVGLAPLEAHRLRAFQWRMFAAGLAPIGLYLCLSLPLRHYERLRVAVEEVALFGAAWSGLLLLTLALVLPPLMTYAWDTVPLPRGESRSMLERLAANAGFRHRELLLWRTGGLISNAAIVGFAPGQKVVLLTDALIADLAPRQLAAVFCHEMGHSIRGHVWLFAAFSAGLFLCADAGLASLPELPGDWTLWIESALLIALALGWLIGFGWLSRRSELDADLTSLELTDDAPALIEALESVSGSSGRHADSWRHFSAVKRSLFLRAAARDAGVGARLRASLGRSIWLAHALLGAGLVGQVVQFADRWDTDQLYVDLRLGRYEEVGAQLDALPESAGDLRELGRVAAGLSTDPGAEGLVAAALGEVRAGRLERASSLLELAWLRGAEAAQDPLEALTRVLGAADKDGVRGPGGPPLPAGLPPNWLTALEPYIQARRSGAD